MRKLLSFPLVGALTLSVAALAGAAPGSDSLVTVGSAPSPFSQNKQNEPAIAIDANHPNIVVAGANDNIDMEDCNAGDDTTCPFTPGKVVFGALAWKPNRFRLAIDLGPFEGANFVAPAAGKED